MIILYIIIFAAMDTMIILVTSGLVIDLTGSPRVLALRRKQTLTLVSFRSLPISEPCWGIELISQQCTGSI